MNPTRHSVAAIAAAFCAGCVLVGISGCGEGRGGKTVKVEGRPFEVWSVYEGVLEARKVETISPRVRGAVVVEELAPEGAAVRRGDIIARFDSGESERDIARLERDYAAAAAEVESLENATHPLALRDLESRLLDARAQCQAEEQYLTDLQALLDEGLVSTQEIRQQEIRVESARKQVSNLETQLDLTQKYLHPLALERAHAAADTLKQELDMARERLSNCVVRAPVDGLLSYRPVSVGGEFRNVRVGDTLYRNQTFMVIPKMDDPIVQISVPEAELSRVQVGRSAIITPVAYPDLRLEGLVESVGSIAQSVAGRPLWHKFFQVTVALKQRDERLRSGMSVRVNILTHSTPSAIVIPRTAVRWDGAQAWCLVVRGSKEERRHLELGVYSDREVEVLNGLRAGERVIVP
jgi:HlyD family secretion protein